MVANLNGSDTSIVVTLNKVERPSTGTVGKAIAWLEHGYKGAHIIVATVPRKVGLENVLDEDCVDWIRAKKVRTGRVRAFRARVVGAQ